MILELDIAQIVLSMILFSPTLTVIVYYLGRRSKQIGEKQFILKIHSLENKVETVRDEKAALIEEMKPDDTLDLKT